VIRTDRRDELQTYLKENGVATAIHYPTALPFMPAYEYLGGTVEDFPVAAAYQNKILSLPMCPELTDDQIKYVTDKIHEFFAK
jgi:dTDP-4-amino-4,6-dideoxygalactose transaminase